MAGRNRPERRQHSRVESLVGEAALYRVPAPHPAPGPPDSFRSRIGRQVRERGFEGGMRTDHDQGVILDGKASHEGL